MVFIEVSFDSNFKFVVGEMYQPPKMSVIVSLDGLSLPLETVTRENRVSYLLGDLNIDLLGCPRYGLAPDLISVLLSHSFLPLMNRPTRATSTSLSLTDCVISNDFKHIN